MNFKRISSRFVAITAILFSLGGPLAQSANAMEPINFQNNYEQSIVSSDYSFSVESYKDWIKDKINMKNSNSNDAQIFLDEFNNLSEDEQKLYVSYINFNVLKLTVTFFKFSFFESSCCILFAQSAQSKSFNKYTCFFICIPPILLYAL